MLKDPVQERPHRGDASFTSPQGDSFNSYELCPLVSAHRVRMVRAESYIMKILRVVTDPDPG
jgi:hypothetical protein